MISAQKGCKHSFRVQNPKYVGSSKLRRNKQLGTSTVEEEDTRYENVRRRDLERKQTCVAVSAIRKRFTGSRAM